MTVSITRSLTGSLGLVLRRAAQWWSQRPRNYRTAEIVAALRELELSLEDLHDAEMAGVVEIRGGRVEFSHPQLRSVAYHAAPPADRRAAHAALATALADTAPTRSVLHRAASVTGPNAALASQLEGVSLDAAAGGAPLAAARTLATAAQFSSFSTDRAERLLAASRHAIQGGAFGYAAALAQSGLAERADPPVHAALELQLGVVKMASGSVREARDELLAGSDRTEAHYPETAALMLAMAAAAYMSQSRVNEMAPITERAVALGRRVGGIAELAADSMHTCGLICAGAGSREGPTLLRIAAEITANPQARFSVPLVNALPLQLFWIERFDDAARLARGWIAQARVRSAPISLPLDLSALADVELRTGETHGRPTASDNGPSAGVSSEGRRRDSIFKTGSMPGFSRSTPGRTRRCASGRSQSSR